MSLAVYAVRRGAAPFEARAAAFPLAVRAAGLPSPMRVRAPLAVRAAGLPSLPFVRRIACPRHAAVLPAVRFFPKKFFEKFVCKRLTSAMEVI